MSEIVYLLGAGASRGKRITDNNPNHFDIDFDENHIIEGLPLVYEIPDRLEYIIKIIRECPISERTKELKYGIESDIKSFDDVKEELISDLQWLNKQSAAHATIDTFAKKLYLTDRKSELYKVEMLLSIFFIIEQIINKPDGRYDTFLASILNSRLSIPDNITILTWNYDSQFELAYKEYYDRGYDDIREQLRICDLKDDLVNHFKEDCNKIFKVNGTANFMNSLSITAFTEVNDRCLEMILDNYFKEKYNPMGTRLSFAWEYPHFLKGILDIRIKDTIEDATTLIVIGYTFPFFNREVDRRIFDNMPQLRKIYIQDPQAEIVKQNILPVLSKRQLENQLYHSITSLTNVNQFFLPPEL